MSSSQDAACYSSMEHASLGDEDSDERSDVYNTFVTTPGFFSPLKLCVCVRVCAHVHRHA